VLAPYQDHIQYVWQENQERAVARNHGLKLAQGELIAFLDADDVWMLDKLSRQVALLDKHPDAVLATVTAKNIGPDGRGSSFGVRLHRWRTRRTSRSAASRARDSLWIAPDP